MDADIAKQAQKVLSKQGMKFKLNTKVVSGDASGEGVKLEVEAAKGGKKETVLSIHPSPNPPNISSCLPLTNPCTHLLIH